MTRITPMTRIAPHYLTWKGQKSKITLEMVFAHLNTYESTLICWCLPKNISGHLQAISGQNGPELDRKSKITSEMVFVHLNTYV